MVDLSDNDELQKQYQALLDQYAQTLDQSSPIPPPEVPSPPPTPKLPPQSVPEPIIPTPEIIPPLLPDEALAKAGSSLFFKILFYFSLLIFLAVVTAIVYSFSKSQPSTAIPSPTPVPTETQSVTVCELNDQTYQIGESFPAADGCNTCACQPDQLIICTEIACEATPSTKLTPTKTPVSVLKSAQNACTAAQLTWLKTYQECEDASFDPIRIQKLKTLCEINNGKFEATASSCRHTIISETNPCGPEETAVCSF